MALPISDVKNSPTDADLYEVGSGDQFSTALAASITASSPASGEVLKLSSTSGLPTNGFLLIKTTNELIRYEGLSTSPVGVVVHTRGWGPTTAQGAASGDSVWLVDVGYYHDLLAAYIQRLMSEHNADGTHGDMTVTGNIVQSDAKYIQTDEIRARDADGLKLYDDGGNGIFVKDGGFIGMGTEPDFHLSIEGTDFTGGSISLTRIGGGAPNIVQRAAGGTPESPSIVQSGNGLGAFNWRGWDGNEYYPGAIIDAIVQGTPGDDTMPTTLRFWTGTPSGGTPTVKMVITPLGDIGAGALDPDCRLHLDTETTIATDVVFQIESDVTTADTVKFRVEADGEAFSDIGFTTFSPVLSTDPDEALDQALADAKKAHKPYKGLFPFADLTELADKKGKVQSRLREILQRIKDTESEIGQLENDIAQEPDPKRKSKLEKQLAALQEALTAHKQDKQRYTKRLAAINRWEQVAKQHGLKGRADEKERWGRDPTRIAMGVALWAEAARQRIAELEAKVAQLEAKLAAQGA